MFLYCMPKMDHMSEENMIVEWLVKPGDTVHTGQVIMRVETAKNVLDVEANFSGTIREILKPAGELIPVNTEIAAIEEE